MATTFIDYTGDGNATKSFSFPSIQVSDVKVEVDEVVKTSGVHYNITNYTTTGGGNVVFTSGNIPSSPAAIRIFRDTDVDNPKATYTAGSSIKAADLNNNQEQILFASQEEQNQSVITSRIKDGAVTTAKIKNDAITNAKIADNQIDSEHYVDGSIDTAHIADLNVTTAKLANDAVTNAKIANDSIDSEHYVDGSIDTAHIGNSQVTTAKIADGNVTTVKLAADSVTGAKIADDQINSEHYVDGSIDTAHIADAQVTTAKLADANVTTAKIAADAVNGTKIADNSINSEHYVDGSIDTDHIANNQVTTIKIADANITAAKIATNAVTTDKIADGELTTLAGMQSGTASKLADSTALTADIADLNQIDGMAKQTTITNDDTKFPTSGAVVDYVAAQLEPFGGFEAIANESSFPNTQPASGVVISIADAGGMVVSGSGTASGATVGGTTVNITGIASNFNGTTITNGVRFLVVSTGSGQNYTYHKATLREDDLANLSGDINDFSERYRVGSTNPTTSLDNGDLFFNTGSGKLLVYNGTNSAWEETQSVGNFFINTLSSSSATGGGSATPNGTAYRFTLSNAGQDAQQHLVSVDGVIQKPNSGSSQPSEGFAIDSNDIIFGSAPVSGASIFVITIGASVSIGTPSNDTVTTAILQNGSVTTPKITDASVTTAKIADQAVTTAKLGNDSINMHKLQSSSVTRIKIATNAVDASKILNQSVTTDKIADDAVTTAKIADDAIDHTKLATGAANTAAIGNGAVTTTKINDQAVTLAKLEHGTSSNDGKFLRANNGADPTFEVVNTDLVADTSPQLGGDLDTNSHEILLDTDHKIKFGDNSELTIEHQSNGNSLIKETGSGSLIFNASNWAVQNAAGTANKISASTAGSVELYHNGNKKFETTSSGATVTGTCTATAFSGDGSGLSGIASFPSGTSMLFAQSSAPTGWTKSTTHNNKALRIVNGTAGSGGSNSFSSVFNSSVGTSGGSVHGHTLSTSQIPSHNHSSPSVGVSFLVRGFYAGDSTYTRVARTNRYGPSQSVDQSQVTVTVGSIGNTGGNQSHSHGFTNPSFNLNVQYVDVIIANKD